MFQPPAFNSQKIVCYFFRFVPVVYFVTANTDDIAAVANIGTAARASRVIF
jgi:hypothetical protein